MHDPDRTGDDAVDEATEGERDRRRADDERRAAANRPEPRPTDPPDLPGGWVPA